ncbi:MAG: PLDc_N domain-containing protein [Acidimicrobiales bacterium]|nr:PLDc_N domain-containing protein [Acidimicrobiales bacterium]
MVRFAPGFLGVILFLLWVWCVLDVIATDQAQMRNLPKMAWLLVVLIVPGVGSVAWLALGRPINAGWTPGATYTRNPNQRVRGPEDDENWGRSDGRGSR